LLPPGSGSGAFQAKFPPTESALTLGPIKSPAVPSTDRTCDVVAITDATITQLAVFCTNPNFPIFFIIFYQKMMRESLIIIYYFL
jgi:hypothetical protein